MQYFTTCNVHSKTKKSELLIVTIIITRELTHCIRTESMQLALTAQAVIMWQMANYSISEQIQKCRNSCYYTGLCWYVVDHRNNEITLMMLWNMDELNCMQLLLDLKANWMTELLQWLCVMYVKFLPRQTDRKSQCSNTESCSHSGPQHRMSSDKDHVITEQITW